MLAKSVQRTLAVNYPFRMAKWELLPPARPPGLYHSSSRMHCAVVAAAAASRRARGCDECAVQRGARCGRLCLSKRESITSRTCLASSIKDCMRSGFGGTADAAAAAAATDLRIWREGIV